MNATISFREDAQVAETLMALLTREQTHLVAADLDAIEEVIEEKSVILQQLGQVAQERYQALAAMGFESNAQGMEQWIRRQNATVQQDWLDFQKVLGQAKEMNRVNGMLINRHFSRNQQMLTALHASNNGGQFYGPNGQATSQRYVRSALQV